MGPQPGAADQVQDPRAAAGLYRAGGDEFFIDLLFYHLKLRCYVVVELKAGSFKAEHRGPNIGLLLCKSKNKVVAEYALGDKTQPMGIAEFKLLESLPVELQSGLPSIEQIEQELQALPDEPKGDD